MSRSSDNFNFPIDLLIEILKRLPLKSLIRSTCVCKSWLNLITCPVFISAHTSHYLTNHTNSNLHLFKEAINVHTETCQMKFSLINTDTLLKQRNINCPVGRKHFIVSSRDGLLCLFDFYSGNPKTEPLILWNPSIRKKLVLPVVGSQMVDLTSGGFPKLIFGFGFDSVSNEYKVVRVAYFTGGGFGGGTRFRADVYGLRGGDWRSKGVESVSQTFSTIRWRGVYMNGVIHWLCNVNVGFSGDSNGSPRHSILTFDLGSEKFGEMNLPKDVVGLTHQTLRVITVRRSSREVLGVVQNVGSVLQNVGRVLAVWTMEEYGVEASWVRLFNVCLNTIIRHDMNVAVLNEQIAVAETLLGGWISYDYTMKEGKKLGELSGGLDYVDNYVESLVLLGQGNAVRDLPEKEVQQDCRKRKGSSRGRKGKARPM